MTMTTKAAMWLIAYMMPEIYVVVGIVTVVVGVVAFIVGYVVKSLRG